VSYSIISFISTLASLSNNGGGSLKVFIDSQLRPCATVLHGSPDSVRADIMYATISNINTHDIELPIQVRLFVKVLDDEQMHPW
jgi:hypothetical protein